MLVKHLGGLLDYYTFCDNDNKTLKSLIYDGMYHQAGESFNYIPSNQSMVEGNDDQGVWGLAVMEAVERNFTDPEDHSWLSMTQAIFNTMDARWDTEHCGGGLRWQILPGIQVTIIRILLLMDVFSISLLVWLGLPEMSRTPKLRKKYGIGWKKLGF